MDFLREIDKLKSIGRQNYLMDGVRKENDAEHSWHLAMCALVLQEYMPEPVDVARTVELVLIHDLVEIWAGDAYAYDAQAQAAQHEKEVQAAEKLFGMLPEDQREYFKRLWEEFEACETGESRFARVMDNCQPLLLNDASGGKSWREHGIAKEQVYKRNERVRNWAPEVWEYMDSLIQKHVELGNLSVKQDSDA
ncbi:MAG: HD domain-containing protein [Lachnospiraceae bacterium]|nr:HD domain-containing protein [Lachnospiraceae bacterium]